MQLRIQRHDDRVQLIVAHISRSAALVLFVDDLFDLDDDLVVLIDFVSFGKRVETVHPVRYARETAVRVNRNERRFAEQFFGIEYIVYLFVLEKTVGIDARSVRDERLAYERSLRRDYLFQFLLEIFTAFGNRS